jgi:glutamate racemase
MEDCIRERAIGVFDSGVGGLTVLRELLKVLPHEKFIYFGDTARVPYGSKSRETVVRYSIENSIFLLEKNIKLLIVACNTASSVAVEKLKQLFNVPVIGVIRPGAYAAVSATRTKRIAVMATKATIQSQAYPNAISELLPDAQIFSLACPLLVPLIEEKMGEHPAMDSILQEYMIQVKNHRPDTLLLGCTHYPLIKEEIRKIFGHSLNIVDSASTVASEASYLLKKMHLSADGYEECEQLQFFVSDDPEKFKEIGEYFLGFPISEVNRPLLFQEAMPVYS